VSTLGKLETRLYNVLDYVLGFRFTVEAMPS